MMSHRTSTAGIIFVFVITFFAMYQETPAQKRPKQPQEKILDRRHSPPDISYTVSMSRPWTHLLEVEMHVKSAQLPDATSLRCRSGRRAVIYP